MTRLAGRVAIVTGAARGIGLAIARRYAAEGALVAIADLDGDRASAAAADLTGAGARAVGIRLDVASEESCLQAVAECSRILGAPDILVNNAAAITPTKSILELDPAEWRRALDINLTGAFLMSRAVLPPMLARGSGVIINVASQLGTVGSAGRAPYCASKAGLIHLTKVMALDHSADGVRVVSLSPGATLTERLLDFYPDAEAAEAALGPKHPIGRLGRPEEIAGAAVFLASADAAFMTGADLLVDGGYTAQ